MQWPAPSTGSSPVAYPGRACRDPAAAVTGAAPGHAREVAECSRVGRGSCDVVIAAAAVDDAAVKLTLDLHEIYNRGDQIDRALLAVINEAIAKKAPLIEIIPGKGSGALKKRVLRFLDQKEIKALYDRVEKDLSLIHI